MQDDDDADWSRMDWARWWLDRGDVDSAAEWLSAGDEVRATEAEFAAIAAAVSRRGLTAMHDEGVAYVYSPEEAAHMMELADRMAADQSGVPAADRKPPSRTSPAPRRKTA
jgi:hypothetical protein